MRIRILEKALDYLSHYSMSCFICEVGNARILLMKLACILYVLMKDLSGVDNDRPRLLNT